MDTHQKVHPLNLPKETKGAYNIKDEKQGNIDTLG